MRSMRFTLLLASLLAAVLFVSAFPTGVPSVRQAAGSTVRFINSVSITNVTSYTLVRGCFVDSETNRVLAHSVTPNGAFTVESCAHACFAGNFARAGVENGQSCFCDNSIGGGGLISQDLSDCVEPCLGDASEACGGFNLFLLYDKGDTGERAGSN